MPNVNIIFESSLSAKSVIKLFCESLNDLNFAKFLDRTQRDELRNNLEKLHSIVENKDDDPNYFNNLIEGCKLIWKELLTYSYSYIDKNLLGLDDLFKYFNEFVDFEELLYSTDEFYRDHTTHLLWTYFLSELLTQKVSTLDNFYRALPIEGSFEIYQEFDKSFEEELLDKLLLQYYDEVENETKLEKINRLISEERDTFENIFEKLLVIHKSSGKEFDIDKVKSYYGVLNQLLEIKNLKPAVRCVAFLCHDLGYPLKRIKNISDKILKLLGQFKSKTSSIFSFSFTGGVRKTLEKIINYISGTYFINENSEITLKKDQSIYLTALMEAEEYEHGIMSAFIIAQKIQSLLSDFIDFREEYKDFSINLSKSYSKLTILKSIALHTCAKKKIQRFLDLNDFLIFIDFLEEFSRMTRASLLGSRVGQFCSSSLCLFTKDSKFNFEIIYKFDPKETRIKKLSAKKTFIDKAKFIVQHFDLIYDNFEFKLQVIDPKEGIDRKYIAIYRNKYDLELILENFDNEEKRLKKLLDEINTCKEEILIQKAKEDFKNKTNIELN